jgi:hypothetical protein
MRTDILKFWSEFIDDHLEMTENAFRQVLGEEKTAVFLVKTKMQSGEWSM